MGRLFGLLISIAGGSAAYYGYQVVGLDNFGGLIISAVGAVVVIAGILLFIGGKATRYANKIANI